MFRTAKRIFDISGSYKGKLKLGFFFGILHSVFGMLPIWAIIFLLERLNRIDGAVIATSFGIMLISVIGRMLAKYQMQDKQSGTGYEIFAEKRLEIGDMLKRVPLGYFNEKSLGEITAALTTTLGDLEMMCMMILDSIVNGVLDVVLVSIFIFFFDWHVGVITLIGLAVAITINSLLLRRSAQLAPQRQAAQAGMVSGVLEYIQGMGVVKAFSLGGGKEKVKASFEESRRANIAIEKGLVTFMAGYQWVFKLAACAIMVTVPYVYLGNGLTLSRCLMLLIASFMIYASMETMGNFSSLIRVISSSLDRVEAIQNVPLMDETSDDIQLDRFDIEFRNVTFSYGKREVVHDVSFQIPQNTTAAIVGPSGSGKTTLCSLIARFWDVDSGEVLVGGRNVREMTCDSLLRNISMVFQNVYLFRDTIAGNIRFGKPDASMEDLIAAAKKARCHDFIMALPEGYDTIVGEGGSSLSGGEKQRISIARAILKDAPIVILDEATASVDPENEHHIKKAIDELTADKTLLTIAHRLSTVREADQILVLDQGRIVQQGSHSELEEQPGIYRRFLDIRRKSAGWQLG